MLGMGSGWWSVTGQVLDIAGFVWLTIDLAPEFAATSARQLQRRMIEEVRSAFERAKATCLAELPENERAFAESSLSIAYDRGNSPGRFTEDVFRAAHRESPGANESAGGVHWVKKFENLALAHLGAKLAGRGGVLFPEVVPAPLWSQQQSLLAPADQDQIRNTHDAFMDRANFRRLWNPFFRGRQKRQESGDSGVSLLLLFSATDRVTELDRFLGRRPRWLLFPATLIILGFVAQVWGSIPI